jgi:dTDP-glucose 4,6-dehydratase
VWGDGAQIRDWMAVEDACGAVELLLERGVTGEVFNVAPEGAARTNLEVARAIARAARRDDAAVYLTEYDRPDHDRRYAVDASKLRALGWSPRLDLDRKIAQTVDWYRANRSWWERLVGDAEALYSDAAERSAT